MTRYLALLGGGSGEEPLEVREVGPGLYEVKVRGRALRVDAVLAEGDTLSVLLEGTSFVAEVEPAGSGVKVRVQDSVFPLEVLDERRLRLRRPAGSFSLEGRQEVVAPLPGRVRKVLRGAGDEVREGEGVAILVALEMENEMRSPKAGRVVEVLVAEGEAVEGGARLFSVE